MSRMATVPPVSLRYPQRGHPTTIKLSSHLGAPITVPALDSRRNNLTWQMRLVEKPTDDKSATVCFGIIGYVAMSFPQVT